MEHFDILIATPGSSMEASYVKSLSETLSECNKRNISYKWINAYSSLVHHARELTASGGHGTILNPDDSGPMGDSVSYKKIFWIDSDISWSIEDFFKLYDSNFDVITGAYLLADGVTTSVHAWENNSAIPIQQILGMKKITKIQSMGFGFVAIKTGVFERMNRPWFKHFPQKMVTSSGTIIEDSIGEDISWCINAYQNGIDIYLDPSVLVDHTKKISLQWPRTG